MIDPQSRSELMLISMHPSWQLWQQQMKPRSAHVHPVHLACCIASVRSARALVLDPSNSSPDATLCSTHLSVHGAAQRTTGAE